MTEHGRLLVKRAGLALVGISVAVITACGGGGSTAPEPGADLGLANDMVERLLPNPNPEVITQWADLPDGRTWGSTAGIDIGPDAGR